MDVHGDERIDLEDRIAGTLGLGPTDVGLAVDDLTLQVGLVDDIELDDADRADTGGGEIEQRRRAESTGTDDEHLGVLEAFLPVHPTSGMIRCLL